MSIDSEFASLQQELGTAGYLCDDYLATTLVLAARLERPLLLEGEAGVGKTEVAKALAASSGRPFIRLQCYDGIDINAAVYEWDYTRQLLSIKLQESSQAKPDLDVFSEAFLLERPLLQSIRQTTSPILLIDEVDRADEAFEAYLLELLSDFQVSIPELGTVKAVTKPAVILTSNGTRELSDALRRRCVYHYLDYPNKARELAIVNSRYPDIEQGLLGQMINFIHSLRDQSLRKRPGIAESLDWCGALVAMGIDDLGKHVDLVLQTRGCFLKTQDDLTEIDRDKVVELLQQST